MKQQKTSIKVESWFFGMLDPTIFKEKLSVGNWI